MTREWRLEAIEVTAIYLGYVALVCLVIAILISTVFFVVLKLQTDDESPSLTFRDWRRLLASGLTLALIGGMAGQLGGASRAGVVGDLVPALLALLGGYASYFLGERKVTSPIIISNGLSFVFAFFILFNLAAVWRQWGENTSFCLELFANPDFNTQNLAEYRTRFFGDYCQSYLPPPK